MPSKTLPSGNQIDFSTLGIGEVITRYRLRVPTHQREYSWTEKQVTELLQDIGAAIARNKPAYFLGTIVLTGGASAEIKEVADGQQRLATTVIILAAIRDFYFGRKEVNRVRHIKDKYLCTVDLATAEEESRLSLNVDDNEFFCRTIIPDPSDTRKMDSGNARMISSLRRQNLRRSTSSELPNRFRHQRTLNISTNG